MGRKANHNPSLGKALMNRKKIAWNRLTNSERHTKEDPTTGLKSVTEESSYDEFIATAALANKDFTAEKLNIKFVSFSTADDLNETDVTEDEKKLVVVPRRPAWTTEMTGEELEEAEKDVFLTWRRSMAQLQEKEGITPFERNLEVWRQLWRVVEKCEIVIQIVDARNPLMYRCEDLEEYVKEMGKTPVLLINKADFLTEEQRNHWDLYFNSIQLSHAFYSAALASLKDKVIEEEDEVEESTDDEEDSEGDEEESVEGNYEVDEDAVGSKNEGEIKAEPIATSQFSPFGTLVLNRQQLIEFLRTFQKPDQDLLNVGLVGYPNVGKSSTINSIMASKKTSVSSTPGKTKHFQTLFLDDDLLLCDCPGLVMPAFGGSKGAMVLGGILPIDQLTNYAPGMAILAEQIPKATLEARYGISLPNNYNFEDVLSSYAYIRGFMTARGLPDSSRASRIILKDYVDGRLVHCHAPPTVPQEQFHPVRRLETIEKEDRPDMKKPTVRKANLEKMLDNQFFAPNTSSAHVKGVQFIPSGLSVKSSSGTLSEKPWRQNNKRNKKEKLRRVYRHLDVE